jgi:hypothetical protein
LPDVCEELYPGHLRAATAGVVIECALRELSGRRRELAQASHAFATMRLLFDIDP